MAEVISCRPYKEMPIPEVGKKYHFFDDGKCRISRMYIAEVKRIWTYDEIKDLGLELPNFGDLANELFFPKKFAEVLNDNIETCPWLYAEEQPIIIELSVPKYDENTLYAVRTKDGGWFTIDIESSWQSGRLDVDGSMYKAIKDAYMEEKKENPNDVMDFDFTPYEI